MRPPEFPGALPLGLPAALPAHAAVFAGDHSLGGAYHQALAAGAIPASAGLAQIATGRQITFRVSAPL